MQLQRLKYLKTFFLIVFALTSFDLFSFTQDIEVGPQIYYLKRTRDGGVRQDGTLYGARVSYERIKDYGFYFGAFVDAAWGPLDGNTGSGTKLTSNFTDLDIQALMGYTISCNGRFNAQFTPFIGVGYLQQTNKLTPPSTLAPTQMQDSIEYYSLGFLSTTTFKNGWQAGLRLTVKWMYEGKCYITNYPSLDDFTQIIDNKMLFTLDLPISYKLFGPCSRYKLTLMPFFQIRHYGGRFNYPIDFYDTRYDTYGARLLLDIQF